MPPSSVVTVRMEHALLTALKQRAAREDTSVSAEIVRLVREGVMPVGPAAESPRRPRSTSGMFADREAPELEELRALRRQFSAELSASTGQPAARRVTPPPGEAAGRTRRARGTRA